MHREHKLFPSYKITFHASQSDRRMENDGDGEYTAVNPINLTISNKIVKLCTACNANHFKLGLL